MELWHPSSEFDNIIIVLHYDRLLLCAVGFILAPAFAWTWFYMMTSSNGNIFRVTGPLCGEFTGHRWIPHTKASNAGLWCFLDLRLNKQLSKQSRGWWYETPSRPLWRHCNELPISLWAAMAMDNHTKFENKDKGCENLDFFLSR